MTFSDAVSAIEANNLPLFKQFLLVPQSLFSISLSVSSDESSSHGDADTQEIDIHESESFDIDGDDMNEQESMEKNGATQKLISVNAKSRKGHSLLYRAAALGRLSIVQFLLDCGAVFYQGYNPRDRFKQIKNNHFRLTVLNKKYRNDNKSFADAFDRVVDHVNRTKLLADDLAERRMSPLLVAAQNGHWSVVKALIDHAKKVYEMEESLLDQFELSMKRIEQQITSKMSRAQMILLDHDSTNASLEEEDKQGETWSTVQQASRPPSALSRAQKLCFDMVEETFHSYSALHLACKFGHAKVVKVLLAESSGIIHRTTTTHATALHIAAKHNQLDVVRLLLSYSALDVNACDFNNWTALNVALAEKHKEIVKLLLDDGRTDFSIVTVQNQNILHQAIRSKNARMVQIVLNAILKRRLSSIEAYGNLDSDILNQRDHHKFRPIDIAIGGRYSKIIAYFKLFLQKNRENLSKSIQNFHLAGNPDALNSLLLNCLSDEDIPLATELLQLAPHIFRDTIKRKERYLIYYRFNYVQQSMTPIEFCVLHDKLKMIDFLLANNVVKLTSSLIHMACRRGKVGSLCKLLDHQHMKEKINVLSVAKKSTLYYAIRSNDVRIVEHLLTAGVDVNKHESTKSPPPFLLACIKLNVAILNLLLAHKNINLDCIDPRSSCNALHYLARRGCLSSVEIMKKIIAKEPQLMHRQDRNNNTPLHIAAKNGCFETAKLLMDHGAPLNVLNFNDMMPVSYVFTRGLCKYYHAMAPSYEKLLHSMLEKGQDVNLKMKGGVSLLHKIADWGDLNTFKLLVEKYGARLHNNQTYKGWNPLHVAIWCKRDAIVEYILGQKDLIDVNTPTRAGLYPIHMAYLKPTNRIANLLKSAGARLDVVDKMNQTPAHYAARSYGLPSLLSSGASLSHFDHHGYTPIHVALHSNSSVYVEHIYNSRSRNPRRHFTASLSSLSLLSYEKDSENLHSIITQHYKHGTTIMHECARWNTNLFQVMRQATSGSDKFEQLKKIMYLSETTKANFTPLMTAVYYGQEDSVDAIFAFIRETMSQLHMKNDIDQFIKELINYSPGPSGVTALHIAFWNNSSFEKAQMLIELGGDLNQKDANGRTCMHLFCSSKVVLEEDLQQYVDLGMKLHIPDKRFSNTALRIFMIRRDKQLVNYIVQKKLMDVNRPINDNGDTPLHIACQKGSKREVKWLLKMKADLHKKNRKGYTPLEVAKKNLQQFCLGKMYHTSSDKATVKLLMNQNKQGKQSGRRVRNKKQRTKRLNLHEDFRMD